MKPRMRRPRRLLLSLCALALGACAKEPDIVVYCALDQIFSQEMIQRFEKETGLTVAAEYDTEASKTVGLVRRLIEESDRTRCDVFWNNEVAHTARLAQMGLLQPYDSPNAKDIPELFRDPERRWTGFAARARVFIVNTELADPKEIDSMWDLIDPKWAGKVGMAKPVTGTTLTHATALFDVLGRDKAIEYLSAISKASRSADVRMVASNGQLMRLVRSGELAWGWTDTDDYNVARLKGFPVEVVYPNQDELGTLVIPNSVAIMKDAPHPENAKVLVDWLLTEKMEQALAEADSAQIPVRASVPVPEHVRPLNEIKAMQVSYMSIGQQIEQRIELFTEMFLR